MAKFIVSLLVVMLVISLSGCAGTSLAAPRPLMIGPSPIIVEMKPVYDEYISNTAAADAKYYGRQLQFNSLTVDKVLRTGGRAPSANDNFMVGDFKFKLRYPSDLQNLTAGTIVDVVGECRGMMFGYILIVDCWIKVVGGVLVVTPWVGY